MIDRAPSIVGCRYGRLVVQSREPSDRRGNSRWRCLCDCGAQTILLAQSLRNGGSKSCGCLQREGVTQRATTHGQSKSSAYISWDAMLQRCENRHHSKWPRYGGRGISVCERWHSFAAFFQDMGPRPAGHTIERKDGKGNYEPSNCCWATPVQQQNNLSSNRRVEVSGRSVTLSQLAREVGLKMNTLRWRLNAGWPVDRAIQSTKEQNQ